MIGGADNSKPVETATLAAAAVDVVKIQILSDTNATVADLRIGHMENATAVPEGGIECGIQMLKKTDKDVIGPGDTFNWTVTVTNPNDCVLTKLKVVDTITADRRDPLDGRLVHPDRRQDGQGRPDVERHRPAESRVRVRT